MDAIINGIKAICNFFSAIVSFVLDMIQNTIDMIVMLGEAATTIPKLFGVFPPILTASLGVVLAVAIAYKILGRE